LGRQAASASYLVAFAVVGLLAPFAAACLGLRRQHRAAEALAQAVAAEQVPALDCRAAALRLVVAAVAE
jgi:hypothetical protein